MIRKWCALLDRCSTEQEVIHFLQLGGKYNVDQFGWVDTGINRHIAAELRARRLPLRPQNPIAPRLNIFSSLAFQKNLFWAFARLSRLDFLNSYHIYKTVLDRHLLPN